ncbi:NADPH-dependent FMN reductase [Pseudorhodoplanes sp.]|uniref:NADPH-dependent FMN reductase n=1 Tax=Pseudorhodoplanes sp. TaxID=1934341 RepID=UPI002B662D13|nr:NADPH-dependent FMN reductase [Pseudorhodoplanes sp.]HWV55772.1 NADPH-dependent FMN reductase [Pseudorhodoplanes sp.]
MANSLNIVTICGSLRKDSYNASLARLLPSLAPSDMIITAAPGYASFPHFNQDLPVPADVMTLCDALRAADGVIIVAPEYGWTIPGALKNALDWVSKTKDQPFKDKPVALQSASVGPLGGSRMQYHMRQTLASIDALVFIKPEVQIAFAKDKFDAQTVALKDQPTIDLVKQQLDAFGAFVRRVKV